MAQITYYFVSYFSLIRSGTFNPLTDYIRFAVPCGNFGDILAGFFAKRIGLPISKFIIATNEDDILHRFWQTGAYEKQGVHSASAEGFNAYSKGVKETLS
jgi:threonine synthase